MKLLLLLALPDWVALTCLLLRCPPLASLALRRSAAVPDEARGALLAAQVASAALLGRLAAHPLHGARITLTLRSARGGGESMSRWLAAALLRRGTLQTKTRSQK